MANHSAEPQMLGYLYQVQYALVLLLEARDVSAQINIERFDDVTFADDGNISERIQLKHHGNLKQGNLSDRSTDLWRTLKIWIDEIIKDPSIVHSTRFAIITTAQAPESSVAEKLKGSTADNHVKDVDGIYTSLKVIAAECGNNANASYYKAFLSVDENLIKRFIGNITVIDQAPVITDCENLIRGNLKYSCLPEHEKSVYERLLGKWYGYCIEALTSEIPVFISQSQIRRLIVDIADQYTEDNLPIDVEQSVIDDLLKVSNHDEVFYKQLELIKCGPPRLRKALEDYYKAYTQRSKWLRDNLIYVDELDEYERRLVDEWEVCFNQMCDRIHTEDEDVYREQGRELLSKIEEKELNIRPKCRDGFIMRGSYHILANDLKIGWHIQFRDRLAALLKGGV